MGLRTGNIQSRGNSGQSLKGRMSSLFVEVCLALGSNKMQFVLAINCLRRHFDGVRLPSGTFPTCATIAPHIHKHKHRQTASPTAPLSDWKMIQERVNRLKRKRSACAGRKRGKREEQDRSYYHALCPGTAASRSTLWDKHSWIKPCAESHKTHEHQCCFTSL